MATRSDHDVRGLQIAMRDSFRVCLVDCVGDLCANVRNADGIDRLAAEAVCERLSFDVFHADVEKLAGLTDIVNDTDMRMYEDGGGVCLLKEALLALRVRREFARQDLQRDPASELVIRG